MFEVSKSHRRDTSTESPLLILTVGEAVSFPSKREANSFPYRKKVLLKDSLIERDNTVSSRRTIASVHRGSTCPEHEHE